MSIDFTVPVGNRIRVGSITLESNGKVDPQEGKLPKQGVVNILDKRVEHFTRSHEVTDLGKAWKSSGIDQDTGEVVASISGNFIGSKSPVGGPYPSPLSPSVAGSTRDSYPTPWSPDAPEVSIASQFLLVDPKAHTVTVQTQDVNGPFFNHWIQASFNAQSGKINPKTINEWVSA